MPELPDVEINRQYLAATALHQTISSVHLDEEKSKRILSGATAEALDQELKGHSFADTHRHGKYCFALLSGGGCLVFHFGMTGFLRYFKNTPQNLGHVRMRFSFDNGYTLVFVNQRLLGTVALAQDPQAFVQEKGLGPDALDGLSRESFQNLIDSSNAKIKTLLTDQQKLAGVGNVYADEILFQAKVHPETPANLISPAKGRRLFEELVKVLEEAVKARAHPGQMPAGYLLPVREKGESCPRCGGRLEKIQLQGRGTYFCPACQKG